MKLSQEELQRAADKAEANFKLLWSFFSEDGRGMTLAGMDEVSENVISIVRNSFVVGTSPLYDIEFPLIGKPQMDISVGYFSNELPDDINLVGNDILNTKLYFDHYAELSRNSNYENEICHEFDASSGRIQYSAFGYIPHISFEEPRSLYKARMEDYLTLVDQKHRTSKAIELYEKSPEYWRPFYQGIFEGREDLPMRITWILDDTSKNVYIDNQAQLERDLESIGVDFDRETMIKPMLEFLQNEGKFEIQVDMYEDGRLGSTVGLACFPKEEYANNDNNKDFKKLIDFGMKYGVADERISLLLPRSRQKTITHYDDEKGVLHKQLFAGSTNIKLKWKDNKMMPMKAYVFLRSYVSD